MPDNEQLIHNLDYGQTTNQSHGREGDVNRVTIVILYLQYDSEVMPCTNTRIKRTYTYSRNCLLGPTDTNTTTDNLTQLYPYGLPALSFIKAW